MSLQAYKVRDILVFANKGTEAKVMAAPVIQSMAAWREDVAGWVALRADRIPELDDQLDPEKTEPYIHS